jgi:starch phosphorylase
LTEAGRTPRFLQHFLVSCSIQDILSRFHKRDEHWTISDHVAIQLNDTHPALTGAESCAC